MEPDEADVGSTGPTSSELSRAPTEDSGSVSPERVVRGRGRGRHRGRARGSARGNLDRPEARGRGVRRPRAGRRGGRTRGARGGLSLDDQQRVGDLQQERNESIQNTINGLTQEEMRDLSKEYAQRHPSAILDILESREEHPSQSPPHGSSSGSSIWCTCHNCRQMPSYIENLCCKQRPAKCISERRELQTRIIDPFHIALIMQYRSDIFDTRYTGDNDSMRHGAYTLYTLWQHKRLGAGNRRVIPSCVVWKIRNRYPEPSGQYVGFQPARLV